jgi:hypothetical protein
MYSFIKPRKKVVFDHFVYLWAIFISLVLVALFIFVLYLEDQNSRLKHKVKMVSSNIEEVKKNIETKRSLVKDLESSFVKSQEVKLHNSAIKSGVENIFLLIPDQVEIYKLLLKEYSVKIYGRVYSPKIYKLLLEPPLKSIFDSSIVGFTKDGKNGYLFTSNNTIKRGQHER